MCEECVKVREAIKPLGATFARSGTGFDGFASTLYLRGILRRKEFRQCKSKSRRGTAT